jgi:L-seryl-tRNA(Ser) seleniumtransferase
MKRRDLIKYLSVAPIAGSVAGSGVPFLPVTAAPLAAKMKRDVIKELGIRTFINAAGTYTHMTGSLMPPEVLEAINVSAQHFVMLSEVQDKVGAKIAALCRTEAAMVTAGCWSAAILGTAAILTGMDRKKVAKLPNLDGFEKTEVIVQRGQNSEYVHGLTNTGIVPVIIDTPEDLEKAITSKTAMMYFLNEAQKNPNGINKNIPPIMHKEWLAVAKKYNIPTLIDIAADVPPVENLWKFTDMGFDLACISGGKALCGPQSAGILMGKNELIAAARLSGFPNEYTIGRGMKVNKEEILGMYVALEKYVNKDHDKEWKMWEDQAAVIVNAVSQIKGVSAKVTVPEIANHTPSIQISWDPSLIKLTTREMTGKLRSGNPSIEVVTSGNALNLTVFMLKPGEEKIVAGRIREELSKAGV